MVQNYNNWYIVKLNFYLRVFFATKAQRCEDGCNEYLLAVDYGLIFTAEAQRRKVARLYTGGGQ
jgi:hypothetical protein